MDTKNRHVDYSNKKVNIPRNVPPLKPVDTRESSIATLIRLILLITAVAAMWLFLSFIPVEFKFDYVDTPSPVLCEAAVEVIPSDTVLEDDIPKPSEEELPDYDFSQPVPEGPSYPVSYFDDTVFIGDSRTAGMILYTKLSPINYSSVGLNIGILSTKNYIRYTDENGEKQDITCLQALEIEKGKYSSVYLSLGINELGWNANSFINTYRKVIGEIREIIDVPLYIQLVLPVTIEASENSTFGITNDKARKFNELLRSLAEELNVFLLDPTELFALDDGTLDPKDSFDGVHLTSVAYKELLAYYQCHIVNTNSYGNLIQQADSEDSDTGDADTGDTE